MALCGVWQILSSYAPAQSVENWLLNLLQYMGHENFSAYRSDLDSKYPGIPGHILYIRELNLL